MGESLTSRAWLWLIVLSIVLFVIIAAFLWWTKWIQTTNAAGEATGNVNGVATILAALLAVVVLWIIGAIFAFIAGLLMYGYISHTHIATPALLKQHYRVTSSS